jgi:hypothetical protein
MDEPVTVKTFNEGLNVGRKIEEGGVLAKLYLGVQGNDLEAAKKALENTVYSKMSAEENITLLEVRMFDIEKEREDYFSGVAEVEILTDDFRWFVNSIMRYGPSAFEILEPSNVKLDASEMHAIAADVADFTHMYSQQIIAMFKDPERRALYQKMLEEEQAQNQ